MVVHNVYLNNLASREGVTCYLAISTSTDFSTVGVTATSIPGEYGSRTTLNTAVTNNVVRWSGIRTGATAPAGGITYTGATVFTALSGGSILFSVPLAGLVHTTNFDIEFNWETTYSRR